MSRRYETANRQARRRAKREADAQVRRDNPQGVVVAVEATYPYSDWTPIQAAQAFARSFPEPRTADGFEPVEGAGFGCTFRLAGGSNQYRVLWEQDRGYVVARLAD